MIDLQTVLARHLQTYANDIFSELKQDDDLLHLSDEDLRLFCFKIAHKAQPVVTELPSNKEEGQFIFRIVSPKIASSLGGIIGNDTNDFEHSGENGITQSNAIIGMYTLAVMRALGGRLLKVNPLTFRNPIPHGKAIVIEIIITSRKRLTAGTIEAKLEENGVVILKKAEIVMSPSGNH